MHPQAKISKE